MFLWGIILNKHIYVYSIKQGLTIYFWKKFDLRISNNMKNSYNYFTIDFMWFNAVFSLNFWLLKHNRIKQTLFQTFRELIILITFAMSKTSRNFNNWDDEKQSQGLQSQSTSWLMRFLEFGSRMVNTIHEENLRISSRVCIGWDYRM